MKLSTRGMSKNQNSITWQRFKAALKDSKGMATNRGFRVKGGHIVTYEQPKLGLSAYYGKRWVLLDGIHAEPIEFYILSAFAGGRAVSGGTESTILHE